ncbi:LysE family transporter [Cellulomonas sp. P22]|uniref:LysE family transporter n=1 Tax=Cellulomonas sp. P22 TaxID=3373189 RepID=UPI0037B4EAA1
MDGTAGALAIGAVAGLAVAVPVGPVGVLLLREGMVHGTRVAVGAACGVAVVDAGYAVLAVAVGVPVAEALAAHRELVRLVSAAVLGGVGVHGLVGLWRARRAPSWSAVPSSGLDREIDAALRTRARPGRSFVRFVALTAVNPMTALTFATVAVGAVAGLGGDDPGGPGARLGAAFVVGAGFASLAWQLAVAAGGGALGRRLGATARTVTSALGSVAVVVLAVVLATG